MFAFRVFSFGFSDSFFEYNLHSRLPPFLAAWLAAVAIAISGFAQWRQVRSGRTSAMRAWWFHVLAAAASLVPLLAVAAILHRAPPPWHLSADDAMGVGIDWLMLVGFALLSLVVEAVVLALARPRRNPAPG